METCEYNDMCSKTSKKRKGKDKFAILKKVFGNEIQPEEWSEGFWQFLLESLEEEQKRRGYINERELDRKIH